MRVFIAGVNGFIGNALVQEILRSTDWEVIGIDVEHDRLSAELRGHERFSFHHGDMSISKEWVEFQIKRSDIIIPLAAVAIPKVYIENPLLVFELDFMANLRLIEHAVRYEKRLIFPSTSEVYGMCEDDEFDEESSNLVLGPIKNQRWIYSCGKQLLDRVVHAYGLQRGFDYTCFRPFNWIGPHLDRIDAHKIGNSRVLTQFVSAVAFNREIHVVDGGAQRRCFLYLDDGIDGLLRILRDPEKKTHQKIINLGNPANDMSIRELAETVVELYAEHPRSEAHPFTAGIVETSSEVYYGKGYEDVSSRTPSIKQAKNLIDWEPKTGARDAIRLTIDSFLGELDGRAD